MNISANTFDKNELSIAAQCGFGLEIEDYLWTYNSDEQRYIHKNVQELMHSFNRFSFHGTAVSRNVELINKIKDEELLSLYNESYAQAQSHGIDKIVFHTNYLKSLQTPNVWLSRYTRFWSCFLKDKSQSCTIFLENFIDDTPELLLQLINSISDSRVRICLDTGHANCNSGIPVKKWIEMLGKHIGHAHLHNNDGITDKHWPLNKGTLDFHELLDCFSSSTENIEYVLECNLSDSMPILKDRT